jgi:hypothetical protein
MAKLVGMSEAQFAAVLDGGRPIEPRRRGEYLEVLADEPDEAHRVVYCARRFFCLANSFCLA